jgi:outer membrane lipoprotein LolB|tara:strand:- start:34 stop:672 length:639 start_codon:yes stop_codon:yes gene_type:complete
MNHLMPRSIYGSIEQVKFGLLLVSVLLSGCTSTLQRPPVEEAKQRWDVRTEYLYQQQDWIAQMALVGKRHQQKFKTRVIWKQQSESYQIKLRDFIGRTVAIIDATPSGMVAKTSKGERYQGDDAEALIDELFAINIPVTGMRYWLQGVPMPNEKIDEIVLDDDGLTKSLSQQGWEISYPHYLQNDPYKMPSHVILEFENISLTVKITQWILQ